MVGGTSFNGWLTVAIVLMVLLSLRAHVSAATLPYSPDWESLDSRPSPEWWSKEKFSLFMHLGLYSVPSFCSPVPPPTELGKSCYAEWFWQRLEDPTSEQSKFWKRAYPPGYTYQDLAPQFTMELFDPDEWATLFKESGARHLIITSKHHEGYALWPSAQSPNWNSVDTGPRLDILDTLSKAVRRQGLEFGMYYSLYEWYHPLFNVSDHAMMEEYVNTHMLPQMKDVVSRYKPKVFYVDGNWIQSDDAWHSREFLAWLFNESPVKDTVIVNDRWGNTTEGHHGDIYICEYTGEVDGSCITDSPTHLWTSHEGMGGSFGYNRLDRYKNATYFIHLLVQSVAYGGHLQLNIGPSADGTIPGIQQQILRDIGAWLSVNGAAIYPVSGLPFGVERSCSGSGAVGDPRHCYATPNNGTTLFIYYLQYPGTKITIPSHLNLIISSSSTVSMLGFSEGNFHITNDANDNVIITLPAITIDRLPCSHSWVFILDNVQAPMT